MRIRTDSDYAYREDAIEQAADFYDCNKTKAVVSACEDVPHLVATARQVLERDDLTHEQRQEIAETLSTRVTNFQIEKTVTIERN
ncbi:DUF7692 domain-containing protein [Halopiger xanaduensis]|uniref:DUF7692 domain-containing protein n=1 Tax=Halopiger xanaduensis (strain DSM 18323 / JCM 14033 / SH-6) TaxID=797210 RepID=F8DCG1_HALXS|nr:hypothetical protein [Halopiger xanaduensis]AEH38425.1 hypothetical protein Halxa_3819 [Halopiger xanaduensis SH-6]